MAFYVQGFQEKKFIHLQSPPSVVNVLYSWSSLFNNTITFGEELKLWWYPLISFLRPLSTASVLGPCIILDTSSQTPSVYGHSTYLFIFSFRRVHLDARSVYLASSYTSSACISTAPTGRISLKSYVGDFCENLFRKSKFGLKSYENIGYFIWRSKVRFVVAGDVKFAIKALLFYIRCYVVDIDV